MAGLAYDYCVATTAVQLSKNGFNVYLYAPATKGIAKESMDQAVVKFKQHNIKILENRQQLTTLLR